MPLQSLFDIKAVQDFIKDFHDRHLPAGATNVGVIINSDPHPAPPKLIGYYIDNNGQEQFYAATPLTGCPYPPHCKNLVGDEKLACLKDYFKDFNMF